ncbi:MAG: hypothetical protein ACP5KW_10795 [Thermoproteota archaeon]
MVPKTQVASNVLTYPRNTILPMVAPAEKVNFLVSYGHYYWVRRCY